MCFDWVKGLVSLLGGGCDGSASVGPPLDPSTVLRMSGPSPRDGFRLSGAGMTDEGVGWRGEVKVTLTLALSHRGRGYRTVQTGQKGNT